jgi:hypothetical protein
MNKDRQGEKNTKSGVYNYKSYTDFFTEEVPSCNEAFSIAKDSSFVAGNLFLQSLTNIKEILH